MVCVCVCVSKAIKYFWKLECLLFYCVGLCSIFLLLSNGEKTDFIQQKCGEITHYSLKISFCFPTFECFRKNNTSPYIFIYKVTQHLCNLIELWVFNVEVSKPPKLEAFFSFFVSHFRLFCALCVSMWKDF